MLDQVDTEKRKAFLRAAAIIILVSVVGLAIFLPLLRDAFIDAALEHLRHLAEQKELGEVVRADGTAISTVFNFNFNFNFDFSVDPGVLLAGVSSLIAAIAYWIKTLRFDRPEPPTSGGSGSSSSNNGPTISSEELTTNDDQG
ncbi:MAG: hypothetical protein AAF387_19765 [Pseudomonadota bacterium]